MPSFSQPVQQLLSNNSRVEFSEPHQEWSSVPNWVRFLIDFGCGWPTGEARPRRIALMSMPCDSASAGLIALGALIRGLGNHDASDLRGYHEALVRYAAQYLRSCRTCDMRCEPEEKRCGYSEEASGFLRDMDGKIWEVSTQTDLNSGNIWLSRTQPATKAIGIARTGSIWLNPKYAIGWQIDGEARPQYSDEAELLPENAYRRLLPEAEIISGNLRRSFSGLCLAGRVAGEAATKQMYSSILFRIDDCEHTLTDLLTVTGWNTEKRRASRMTFFNGRTGRVDRGSYAPALVVADGDLSFLKVLSHREFNRSDVIGVIHRAIERDNLEAVGNRLSTLNQWYQEDDEFAGQLQHIPAGISIAILKKRVS